MTGLRLLALSRYTRQGASSRLRMLQYLPYLEEAGFNVDIVPLFDAAYLEAMYSGRRSAFRVTKHYARRLRSMRSSRRADLVWVQGEGLPWLPWRVEQLLHPSRTPLVSDYDDAIFHRYDRHRSGMVRRLCWGAKSTA